jgi:CelD/BcsL family acetyltransferase involved in cellulose biosynthesis
VTARADWLDAWEQAHPAWSPWAVLVQRGERTVAGALLASRRRGPLVDVVALGHGQSDYARLPAADVEAASSLAGGIVAALDALPGPWRLRLEQLPRDEPALLELASRLPHSVLSDGDGAPVIDLLADPAGDPPTLPGGRSRRSDRVSLRRARNKLHRDGVSASLETVRSPAEVRRLLPEVAALHRARDRALGRRSDLDDRAHRTFWWSALLNGADRGEVEVALLRIDGRPAAEIVALLDGPVYRAWEVRMAPDGATYSAGHLLRAELLERLRGEGGWTAFDWMRGEEGYKLTSATHVVPASSLRAWATPTLRSGERLARSGLARFAGARTGADREGGTP